MIDTRTNAHPVWTLIKHAVDDAGDDLRNASGGPTLIAAALLEVRDAIVASNKPAHYESGPTMAQTAAVLEAARAWALVETTTPQPSSTGVGDWAERREAARAALLAAVEAAS